MPSPVGPPFSHSLSPLAEKYQPPLAQQNTFYAPSHPLSSNLSDIYNTQSLDFTQQLQHMQHTEQMQPYQFQEPYNTSMPRSSSPYSNMQTPSSAFSPAQARGMPKSNMVGNSSMRTPNLSNMQVSGRTSLTPQQRPIAQPYPPSARTQQLQSPLRTPSANAVRTNTQHVTAPLMQAGTPNQTPSFEQQLQALANSSFQMANMITPPSTYRAANDSSKTPNHYNMGAPNARKPTPAPAVQAPQAAAMQPNMVNANMRGQKRPADDTVQAFARAIKARADIDAQGRQVVTYVHPQSGETDQMSSEAFQKWGQIIQAQQAQKHKMDEAHKAEQMKNELARRRAHAAEEEKKKKAADAKARDAIKKMQAERADKARREAVARQQREKQKQMQEAAAKAAKEKAEQERQARIKEQQRIDQQALVEAEKQRRLAAEKKAWAGEQAEQHRIAQEARLEKERKQLRKEQLRSDSSALYRHYREFLQFFPLHKGESPNRYLQNLLANKFMPADETEELALAIAYGRDHWHLYLQYPRDVKIAASWQKENLAKRAAEQQHSTSSSAPSKQPSKR